MQEQLVLSRDEILCYCVMRGRGWVGGWKGGWVGGWMGGWMGGWLEGWVRPRGPGNKAVCNPNMRGLGLKLLQLSEDEAPMSFDRNYALPLLNTSYAADHIHARRANYVPALPHLCTAHYLRARAQVRTRCCAEKERSQGLGQQIHSVGFPCQVSTTSSMEPQHPLPPGYS